MRPYLYRIALPLCLLCGSSLFPMPLAAEVPGWVERWLFNQEERTRQGIQALEDGKVDEAMGSLETALRLDRDDPTAQFNAGTGRLLGQRRDASGLLQEAADGAGPALTPLAHYNLGNAHLNSGDLPAAIESYKDSLRAAPGFENAKHNLELAQKMLKEQQQEQEQNQQDQEQNQENQDQENQDQQEQNQEQDQENQDQQEQEQEEQDNQDQQQDEQDQDQQDQEEQQEQEQKEQKNQEQNQQQKKEERLPDFEEQPEMSAEEAAAILEAVENQERERRRQEALEAQRKSSRVKKDW